MSLPEPYAQGKGWTLYHGDCLAILPHLPKVDAVVTSPPYNTLPSQNNAGGMHANNKWVEKASAGYFDQRPEEEYQGWIRSIVAACIERCDGLVWVNHKVRYRDGVAVHPVRFLPFPIYSEVIWDRGGGMALNCKRYAPSHESMWAFGTPKYWDRSLDTKMSVWQIAPTRNFDGHPCPYPVEFAARPIHSSCPVGGYVLDPFTGSGTTGIAAIGLDRQFIGIEIDETYCEIAAKRLRRAEADREELLPLMGVHRSRPLGHCIPDPDQEPALF